MSDWISAGVNGFFDFLGGGLNAISSAYNAKKQYKYNLALQNDAQAHQIDMYKHQNQWRVEDLRNAGLNPILSTHAASSMPSSGMNSVSMPNSANFDFKNSAKSIERALFKRNQKENELLDAQISSAKSQVDTNMALMKKYSAEANNINLNSDFEFSPEVIALKLRQLKYNSSGRFGKEFGIPDEVIPLVADPSSALGIKVEHDKFFNKIFPNEMRKQYKKSFPFLFK